MNFKAISAALICILILDFMYLSLTKNFYNNLVKSIQGENIVINNLGLLLAYFFYNFQLLLLYYSKEWFCIRCIPIRTNYIRYI